MKQAGVNHKCKWAVYVTEAFLEGKWTNKNIWRRNKLWDGEYQEYQLGTSAMRYLQQGRNALTRRVRETMSELVYIFISCNEHVICVLYI